MASTETSEVWVGLVRRYDEGNWTWSDGTELDYIHWSPDTDDLSTVYCVTYKNSLLWGASCWETYPYVCEYIPSK